MSCNVTMSNVHSVRILHFLCSTYVLPRARPRRTPSTALQAWSNRVDMLCVRASPMGHLPGHSGLNSKIRSDAVLDDRCHDNSSLESGVVTSLSNQN